MFHFEMHLKSNNDKNQDLRSHFDLTLHWITAKLFWVMFCRLCAFSFMLKDELLEHCLHGEDANEMIPRDLPSDVVT